jgi:hypothetical protein
MKFNGSEKARREISTNPHEAVATYTQLRNISSELISRNEKAWGSMIHLIEYVEESTKQLWEEMEQTLSVYVISWSKDNGQGHEPCLEAFGLARSIQ